MPPVDWIFATVGDLVTLQRGIDLPDAERTPGHVPIVGSFGITGRHHVPACKGPGVCVGRSGASIGALTYVAEDYWPLNTCLYVKDFRGNSPRFAYYFLKTIDFAALNSGSAQPSLNRNFVHPVPASFPDLKEQQAIASVLGALDDKIDLNRRMNETLEAMARAIFKDWFVDFGPVRAKAEGRPPYLAPELWSLFPDALDDEDKPVGWDAASLLDMCQLKRGYDLPTGQRIPGPHPIISSSGKSGYHSVSMAEAPGVVTGRYGTVGEVFFISQPFWPLNTALYIKDFKGHPHRFVYYMLREIDFLRYSDKAAVPGVNRNHLHQASIILPALEVQQAFAHALTPLWTRQDSNEMESETLSQLRDLLLPKLMSGEIRLKDAEKAVEAAL